MSLLRTRGLLAAKDSTGWLTDSHVRTASTRAVASHLQRNRKTRSRLAFLAKMEVDAVDDAGLVRGDEDAVDQGAEDVLPGGEGNGPLGRKRRSRGAGGGAAVARSAAEAPFAGREFNGGGIVQ